MKLNPTGAPVETKVVSGATYGSITLFAVWILITYVFHGHIPSDLATLLPGLVGTIAGTGAAWLSRHTPRTQAPSPPASAAAPGDLTPEVLAEVMRLLASQGLAPVPGHAGNVPPPPAPVPPAGAETVAGQTAAGVLSAGATLPAPAQGTP